MPQLRALKNEFPIGAYLGTSLVTVGVFLQLSYFNQLTALVDAILALKAAKAPLPTNQQAAQVLAARADKIPPSYHPILPSDPTLPHRRCWRRRRRR